MGCANICLDTTYKGNIDMVLFCLPLPDVNSTHANETRLKQCEITTMGSDMLRRETFKIFKHNTLYDDLISQLSTPTGPTDLLPWLSNHGDARSLLLYI